MNKAIVGMKCWVLHYKLQIINTIKWQTLCDNKHFLNPKSRIILVHWFQSPVLFPVIVDFLVPTHAHNPEE